MTTTPRIGSVALAAVVTLAIAPAAASAQEASLVAGSKPSLFETVTVDAVGTTSPGLGVAESRFCGSPFDVRFGPYWSVFLPGPFGYRPYGRSYGWYGWNRMDYAFFSPFGQVPCSRTTFAGWGRPFGWYGGYGGYGFYGGYAGYGFYGGHGWPYSPFDPWTWGFGYNPYLAYGAGSPKSGWWAPGGYGYAPYGVDRDVLETLARTKSAPQEPRAPRTSEAGPADVGEDGPGVTRFGSEGIRARGAELRKVRPDLPPVVVLGGVPGGDRVVPIDGTALRPVRDRPPTRETLGDAIARSRAELTARRIEIARGASDAGIARRVGVPSRSPELFPHRVEPPRAAIPDRGRDGISRFDGGIRKGVPGLDRGASRSGSGAAMRGFSPPRSFTPPPKSSPSGAPARSGGGSGKTAAPE